MQPLSQTNVGSAALPGLLAVTTAQRVSSIDLLRGLVMILMALDHVRDYFHWSALVFDPTDLQHTTTAIFLTRWITHFCAPVFVFLAGTSAFFVSRRRSRTALVAFLFTRGLWLVVLEFTVVNFAWLFNITIPFFILQVIWALGMSMVALSSLVLLPRWFIALFGFALVFGHNAFDNVHYDNVVWAMLHDGGLFQLFGRSGYFAYPLVPWIGVMPLGYCFGVLYTNFASRDRKRWLLVLGHGCIVLFLALRLTNLYGDAQLYQPNGPWLSILDTTKYPPSLQYLLMTLGPAFLFLAYTEKAGGKLAKAITVFGRVPLFYYLAHLFLIHLLAMAAAQLTGFGWQSMILDGWIGFSPELRGYGFPLWVVYVVWLAVVMLLYPLCKWYDGYKMRNKGKVWLSYL